MSVSSSFQAAGVSCACPTSSLWGSGADPSPGVWFHAVREHLSRAAAQKGVTSTSQQLLHFSGNKFISPRVCEETNWNCARARLISIACLTFMFVQLSHTYDLNYKSMMSGHHTFIIFWLFITLCHMSLPPGSCAAVPVLLGPDRYRHVPSQQ